MWREDVFKRDDYTCQKTKERGGRVVAHHILNFADNPEERLNVDNGITLSEDAHRAFHKKYGNKNTTREQMKEFLECHDEIIVEVPEDKAEEISKIVKYEMENAVKLPGVPLVSEPKITKQWEK